MTRFSTYESRIKAALVGLAFLLTVAPVTIVSADQPEATEFIIGLQNADERRLNDDFHGGRVKDVNVYVDFIVVETRNPTEFENRARGDPGVRYIEPNPLIQLIEQDGVSPTESESEPELLFTPNDGSYGSQYGPKQIRANVAWDTTLGDTDAKVCIVDSGVRYTHQDLSGRWFGGWDYVNGDSDPWDDNGHGTHVAGIAAATINNGVGIAGIGNVGIYGVKVLNSAGSGTFANAANGITWCANNAGPRTVINLSLGCYPSCYDQATVDAINYAYNTKGQLVVAAAGNDGPCSNCVGFPADQANAMAISCTDANFFICGFSSTGPQVDLAAPGDNILSTCFTGDSSYCTKSGTSMSTPTVAGAAALHWSWDTGITNAGLNTRLRQTAVDLGGVGYDQSYGDGLVNAKCLINFYLCKPSNDNFASSFGISGYTITVTEDTLGARMESGEPTNCGMAGSVWLTWTAGISGTATIDTFTSDFDTVLGAYTGSSLGGLSLVACNDQSGGDQSQVVFQTSAGTTYRIQVGGWSGTGFQWGNLVVHVKLRPTNDNFANAITLTSPSTTTGTNIAGTSETGEPLPCSMSGNTVWYQYTAGSSGSLTIDTFSSNFDTVLAVYTGSSVNALTQVACNDEASGSQSLVTFTATSGTTYRIQVGGWGNNAGTVVLNLGRPVLTTVDCPSGVIPNALATCTFVAAAMAPGVSYTVNWGDGATTTVPSSGTVAPGMVQSASHSYSTLGAKTVTFTSTNNIGLVSQAVTRTINVVNDATPPTLLVTDPVFGFAYVGCTKAPTVVTNPTFILQGCAKGTASDSGSGLAHVKVYQNGVLKATSTTSPFTFQWGVTGPALGQVIDVIATDNAGNTATFTQIVDILK